MAGEIAIKSPEPDAANGEAYFGRALAIAREQQSNLGNSAPLWAWIGSGVTRGSGMRLASSFLPSTASSLKAPRRSI